VYIRYLTTAANLLLYVWAKIPPSMVRSSYMVHHHALQEHDVLPTLKALQALTEDKLEVIDPSTGELAIVEPKKVRAIGLVDFPPR